LKKKKIEKKGNAEELRKEVEKAKIKDELSYLHEQQKKVRSELEAEKERCKSRDDRIKTVSDELNRVDQEKTRLQRNLLTEQKWKNEAEDRILKLQEELQHINQEEQGAENRLNSQTDDTNWE